MKVLPARHKHKFRYRKSSSGCYIVDGNEVIKVKHHYTCDICGKTIKELIAFKDKR